MKLSPTNPKTKPPMQRNTQEPTIESAMTPKDIAHMHGCQAAGLLYLLAVAVTKSDVAPYSEPSANQKEGIDWLAADVSQNLQAALEALSEEPLQAAQPPTKSAA